MSYSIYFTRSQHLTYKEQITLYHRQGQRKSTTTGYQLGRNFQRRAKGPSQLTTINYQTLVDCLTLHFWAQIFSCSNFTTFIV